MSDGSCWGSITAIIVKFVSLWNINPFSPMTNEEKPLLLFFSVKTLEKSDSAETKLVSSLMFMSLLEFSLMYSGFPSLDSMYMA